MLWKWLKWVGIGLMWILAAGGLDSTLASGILMLLGAALITVLAWIPKGWWEALPSHLRKGAKPAYGTLAATLFVIGLLSLPTRSNSTVRSVDRSSVLDADLTGQRPSPSPIASRPTETPIPPVTTQRGVTPSPTATAEYMLAVIEHGRLSPSDLRVKAYAIELDALEKKCTDTRERIGAFAIKVRQILKEQRGIEEPILVILRAVNFSIPEELGPISCSDVFAVYAVLRIGRKP